MFYVSGIKDKASGQLIGVTDTSDNVEEFISNDYMVKLHEEMGIRVFGTSIYNHKAECTVLKLGIRLNRDELIKRVDAWKAIHNPWMGLPVADYLACAVIDTVITIKYIGTADADHSTFTGITVLTKLSYDKWKFSDVNSTIDGEVGNSDFASMNIEGACIYCRPVNLIVS